MYFFSNIDLIQYRFYSGIEYEQKQSVNSIGLLFLWLHVNLTIFYKSMCIERLQCQYKIIVSNSANGPSQTGSANIIVKCDELADVDFGRNLLRLIPAMFGKFRELP